jgi:broad specificity phosphatase PhoE
MRVLVTRHLKTCSNADNRIIGWGDSPPAPDWEADVAYVNGRLREQAEHPDAIYSSALARACRTADYHAEHLGIGRPRHSVRLNEIHYGRLQRETKDWVERHVPEYKTDPDYVFPDGESFRAMQARCLAFVRGLEARHRDQTLLLVVHAGVIRGLICGLLGLPYGANLKRKISHRYLAEFQLREGRCLYYQELGRPSGFVRDGVLPGATWTAAERTLTGAVPEEPWPALRITPAPALQGLG